MEDVQTPSEIWELKCKVSYV